MIAQAATPMSHNMQLIMTYGLPAVFVIVMAPQAAAVQVPIFIATVLTTLQQILFKAHWFRRRFDLVPFPKPTKPTITVQSSKKAGATAEQPGFMDQMMTSAGMGRLDKTKETPLTQARGSSYMDQVKKYDLEAKARKRK